MPKDGRQAEAWYVKSAEQGDSYWQKLLALKYAKGEGITKDEQKAFYWFRKAAQQGESSAQWSLGEMYAEGRGVTTDPVAS
ncbi:Localization factor PodJL [compost metagenome]